MTYSPDIAYSLNDTSMDAWGRPKTYIDHSAFHGLWTYDVPDSIWRIKENGVYLVNNGDSVNIESLDGRLSVNSGPTLNDVSFVKSKRSPRYQPNRGHLFSTAFGLPNPTALGERDIGLFTEENGVFFRLKQNGSMYACIVSNSILIKEELITPNFSIDYSKGNIYDIQFQWRGVGDYNFLMGNPSTKKLETVHSISFLNSLDQVLSIKNPALPVCYRAKNLGDNVNIWAGCVDVSSEGGTKENRVTSSISSPKGGTSLPSGAEIQFMALMVNETFNGEINTRDIALRRMKTSCTNESIVTIYRTRNPSVVTGTTWSNVNGNDNVKYAITSDLVIDLNHADLHQMVSDRVEQDAVNQITNPDDVRGEYFLSAGDIIVITVDANVNDKFWATIEYSEEI